ncbi:hypothetical protein ABRY23_08265 [Melioribacteraceae bacterium 4301-Me]|uniref:hypothetical protein n=1 Tax=Pyranulibacter aquaticus TaxID=3163344 RepID=UPI00359799AF
MNISDILISKKINPLKVVYNVTAQEILHLLSDALNEFSISFDLSKLSKKELEKILSDYAETIEIYHSENYHRERATLLRNETILRKYGLTIEQINKLDFV